MQISVLLSIKPQFADGIFGGSKRYEFRKVLFKDPRVKRVLVYATSPVSQVIGEFEIETVLTLEPSLLWEYTQSYSGISKAFFDSYFMGCQRGHAIKVGRTHRYVTPLTLEQLNVRQAPQSFVYITHGVGGVDYDTVAPDEKRDLVR
jgi:predicted transcriptional regulator